MDLSLLSEIWLALGTAGQAVCTGAAGEFIGGLAGEAWKGLTAKDAGKALADVYRRWKDGLLDSTDDRGFASAFGEFFGRAETRRELEKLLRGNYPDVNFETLEREMRASCEFARCPLPDISLSELVQSLVEGLLACLEESPEYQAMHRPALLSVLESLRQSEPGQRNYSLARRAYLAKLREAHRLIQFRGFDSVDELVEVNLKEVFVMPRLARAGGAERETKPDPAEQVFRKRRNSRMVILKEGRALASPPWYPDSRWRWRKRRTRTPGCFPSFTGCGTTSRTGRRIRAGRCSNACNRGGRRITTYGCRGASLRGRSSAAGSPCFWTG